MKNNSQLPTVALFLLAITGPAFAQTVTFNVSDSRGNPTGQCMKHRQNIVDVKPCEARFGNSDFEFNTSTNLGYIKMDGKCLGLNKARANVWSANSTVGLVDCDNSDFIALTWELNGVKLVPTNQPIPNKYCLGVHPRFNQKIALGECANPAVLPQWSVKQ